MILIVDDEYLILFALQLGLQELGHEVLTASDGNEALALYSKHKDRIKYIVTDWTMPQMSGKDFVTALRADNPYLKIIITSGHFIDPQSLGEADSSLNYFLPKPFRAQALIDLLEKI